MALRVQVGVLLAILFGVGAASGAAHAQQAPYAASPGSWAAQMLDAHNAVRARTGVPPLQWSEQLANYAQQWADFLGTQPSIFHRPNNGYGENIFWSSVPVSGQHAVESWASEGRYYDRSTNTCSAVCGHYTQLIWGNTRVVGCGVSRMRGEIVVCNYYPPGNYRGIRPF